MEKARKKEVGDLYGMHQIKLEAWALIPEWVVLWPHSLIAGVYDSVDATALWLRWLILGREREEESFVSLFIFPLNKALRKPQGSTDTCMEGMATHKMVLYASKKD